MFRKNEMLLKSQISTMSQNLVKKNRAITQYLNCKSKQQQEETFKLFIKEMNKQFKNNNLTSFTDYSTVKDCFIKEEEIFERKKSSENNEDCTLSETFPEEDIKALDQLISKKYDILWRWNKALFNYEFASRNIKSTVYFLQKVLSFYRSIFHFSFLLHYQKFVLNDIDRMFSLLITSMLIKAAETVFDLVTLIVQFWKDFCKGLGGTMKCFLDVMPTKIGGQNKSCL
ncbi:unnamed protein product [Schistosoma rodhaini]|uniref:Uncharacterized protein n=1 Tax=Schistosoma rodhaini TaxID=6188 RepID=A0AA85GDL1_9TREM|nr:unnamed protein product [Schistosoma rodhaini]